MTPVDPHCVGHTLYNIAQASLLLDQKPRQTNTVGVSLRFLGMTPVRFFVHEALLLPCVVASN
jgi:hypothetical protein